MTALWQLAWAVWWAPTAWWVDLVLRAAEQWPTAGRPDRPSAQVIDLQEWLREHPRAQSRGGHAA